MVTVNQKNLIIIILIGIFTIMVTLKWIYEPRSQEIKALLKTLDEEYEKNKIFLEIKRTKEDVERRVDEDLLKSEKDLPWLLGKVSEIFKSLGLEIISLEPQPLEKGIYYTRMPVKVKTVCNYHKLGELISKLENLDKFVDVGFLEIKPLGELTEKEEKKSLVSRKKDEKGFVLLETTLSVNSLYPNY